MPTYLEQRTAAFDKLSDTIEELLARAVEEDREVTKDEQSEIDKLEVERSEAQKSVDVAAALEIRRTQVAEKLSKIPAHTNRQTAVRDGHQPAQDPEKEILREVGGGSDPTPGDWAALVYQAWVKRDKSAAELIERATAHQLTTDNPGLIPKQIVGPVIDRMRTMRPLIASLGAPQTPPGPKFDRPIVTQHVDVDEQVAEKDPTASRKMLIGGVEVLLHTHAGHLNISKQDIRWSRPSILNLVYLDFAKMYARRSDKAACVDFAAAVTATQEIAGAPGTYTPSAIDAALGAVATTLGGPDGDNGELNHVWMSRDVAVQLASLRNANTGQKVYNIPLINGTSGDLDGLPVTIDPRFAAGTFISGDDTLVEFWEDLEGFMSVDEPDVLGQLVGYAGYNALAALDPTGFVKLTNIAALAGFSATPKPPQDDEPATPTRATPKAKA